MIGQHEHGKSNREIRRLLDIDHQTVKTVVSKWKQEGHCRVKTYWKAKISFIEDEQGCEEGCAEKLPIHHWRVCISQWIVQVCCENI